MLHGPRVEGTLFAPFLPVLEDAPERGKNSGSVVEIMVASSWHWKIVVAVGKVDRRVHFVHFAEEFLEGSGPQHVFGVALAIRPDIPLQRTGSHGFSLKLLPMKCSRRRKSGSWTCWCE